MGRISALSATCSVALLPGALLGRVDAFLVLVAINFVVFHAIWLLPRFRGLVPTEQFFREEMRLPLALFMICGIAGLLLVLTTS